jgi:hypothetical protein
MFRVIGKNNVNLLKSVQNKNNNNNKIIYFSNNPKI